MRPRFKPNITPRAARRTNVTSNSGVSGKKANIPKEISGDDTSKNEPFIPPNSAKAVEESVYEENNPIEDTIEVVVVEKVIEEDSHEETAIVKTPKTSTNKKPTSTRRSRIKPSVTPVPRRRTTVRTNESEDNSESTPQDEVSVENSIEKDEPKLKKHQNNNENTKSTSTPTETPSNTSTTTAREPQSDTSSTRDDPQTQASSSSLSRRRRTTPKICIPPRKRRMTSLCNENVDKNDGTAETLQQDGDFEDLDEEIPENSAPVQTNKRQKVQEEVAEEDIGIIEVTVQTREQSEESVVDEDQDGGEEEKSQASKNSQLKGKKKRVPIKKPKEMLDPSKMTLQDLIYFNPKENYMKSSTEYAKNKKTGQQKRTTGQSNASVMEVDESNTENQSNNQQTTDKTEGGGDSTVCAPQVKIAADGSIIVDEESLLIRSPTHSTLEDTEIVYEDANHLNYDFYGKGTRRARWSMPETLKFYKALSQVGTDFQLMVPLFPMRTRKELKAKFKKEEKMNYELIDKVLVHHTPISLEMFLKGDKDTNPKNTKKKGRRQDVADKNESNKETEQEGSSNSKRISRRQMNTKETDKETDKDDSNKSKSLSRRQMNTKEIDKETDEGNSRRTSKRQVITKETDNETEKDSNKSG